MIRELISWTLDVCPLEGLVGEECTASGYSGGGKVSILNLLSSTRVPLTFRGPWFGLDRIHLNDEVSWLLSAHEDSDSNSYQQDNRY
jgi:hypothetical protein